MRPGTISSALLRTDVRNLLRDPLLIWIAAIPLILALVYRLSVPWLTRLLAGHTGFDLEPLYPLIAGTFVVAAPGAAGMIFGFLLLDERDDGIVKAIAVSPLSPVLYLLYRLALPALASIVMTLACYSLLGFVSIRPESLLAICIVASLNAPITALVLGVFAENKVSGFAVVKVMNAINILPVAAWFIDEPVQWFAGFVPSYWAMKMLWLAAEGDGVLSAGAVGLIVGGGFVAILAHRFQATTGD